MNDSDPIVTKAPAAHTGFEVSAISRGLVSTAMVEECRVLHTKLNEIGLPMSLGEVYVKKGYLAPPQVEIIESELVEINADAIPGHVITDKIATGGMGAVYKARQLSMDRVVAIKVLLPKFAGDAEGQLALADAVRAAQALMPGQPIEAEIVLRPGRAVVVVRVRDAERNVQVVVVDGNSGVAAIEPGAAATSSP